MKIILSIFTFFILNTYLFSAQDVSRFGFLNHTNNVLDFKDARDSLSNWIKDMGLSNDLNVETKFFNSVESLLDSYIKGELDMIVISLPDYFQNENRLKNISKDFWSATFSEENYSDFYLITRSNSNINTIKDISNKSISLEVYNRVPEVWIDKLSLLSNKKTIQNICSNVKKENKESTALLNVFFNKSDLAVVSGQTWDDMIKFNPSISKKLKIIEKSEKNNLPFVGFFHKNAINDKVDEFYRITSRIEDSVRAEELITLLKFRKFFKVDEKYLSEMKDYHNEYFELKSRYK